MIVEHAFEPIIGNYVWSVKKGHAGYLTLQFGNPHLEVREPIEPRRIATQDVRELLARRRVFLIGDWSLLIQNYHWIVCHSGDCIRSEDEGSDKALERLDGQKLVDARFDKSLELSFDLGTDLKLKLGSVEEMGAAQWTLFRFQGDSLTLRNDGSLSKEMNV